MRFYNSAQYASITDTNHINYNNGLISFWYQMETGAGSNAGVGAVFFRRAVGDTTQFMFCRSGSGTSLNFYIGDTANGNRAVLKPQSNIFDGNQHFISFSWNCVTSNVALTVDGVTAADSTQLTFPSNPSSWKKANLQFGMNIDGYLEDLIIRSQTSVPVPIVVAQTNIDTTGSWLPPIQQGFNDTVDCIVISPDSTLFREECDKYALRNMSMGIRTAVVNFNQVVQLYSGSDVQERLRNFLKYAYLQWHSKYVVIAGSTNLIPARKIAFQSQSGQQVTTDRYYGCLVGNWNDNGNQYFAEAADSVDFTSQLIVARFPAETWNQLRTMIDRSNMGFGLPPYRAQCMGNVDSVMLTGISMFGNVGSISDGQYYGNQLQTILQGGVYTSGLRIKSYYPSDDPSNLPTDAASERWNKFMSKLNGFPGLWVHYGHGESGNIIIDRGANEVNWVELDENELYGYPMFNRFQRLGHVRVVGCAAASQDYNSAGRVFLLKPYGGALTYIGTSECSYPAFESQLLQAECANVADSTIFTWGDIFGKAANDYLANYSLADIGKWVALSRNFFGDPLLPVRTAVIDSTDTLHIATSGTIENGSNSIEVTVTDKNGNPVEGALVGLAPLQVSRPLSDASLMAGQTVANATFGHCLTNGHGQGTLSFTLISGDSILCITATHADFLPSRITMKAGNSSSGISCYLQSVVNMIETPLMILAAGDWIFLTYRVLEDHPIDSVAVRFDTSGTNIHVGWWGEGMASLARVNNGIDSTTYNISLPVALDICLPGVSSLGSGSIFMRMGLKSTVFTRAYL